LEEFIRENRKDLEIPDEVYRLKDKIKEDELDE